MTDDRLFFAQRCTHYKACNSYSSFVWVLLFPVSIMSLLLLPVLVLRQKAVKSKVVNCTVALCECHFLFLLCNCCGCLFLHQDKKLSQASLLIVLFYFVSAISCFNWITTLDIYFSSPRQKVVMSKLLNCTVSYCECHFLFLLSHCCGRCDGGIHTGPFAVNWTDFVIEIHIPIIAEYKFPLIEWNWENRIVPLLIK